MKAPIRILLADDHTMLRQGTAEILRQERDFEVTGEASDGQEAVDLALSLRPDVVVMDVRMPILSGIEATTQIRAALPDIQILVLSAHDDEEYIFSLLKAGASGYLLKTAPANSLMKAIRQVMAGESPLDPAIARKVVVHLSGERVQESDGEKEPAMVDILTARELEVLQLLAQGLTNRAIAETLFISERTVQAHLANVFVKMGVSSRLEAVLAGIRRGWLTLDQHA